MNHSLMSSTRSTSKGKKRPKSNVGGSGGASPCSPPEQEPPSTLRRKASAKKPPKKSSHDATGDGTLLSLDASTLYNNPALPPLPQYDDRLDGAGGPPPPVPSGLMGLDFPPQAQQAPAQQPPTYLPYSQFQEPSPPHSVTFSPPAVSRSSLPTSPPHMAAMRIVAHQSHASSMHYTDPFAMGAGSGGGGSSVLSNPTYQPTSQPAPQPPPQQLQPQIYHFLTPPSEPTERNSYPTPSPESPPYYWSSSSPHSNSDWSEGILSPNASSHLNKQSEPTFV